MYLPLGRTSVPRTYDFVAQVLLLSAVSSHVSLQYATWLHKCPYYPPFGCTCRYYLPFDSMCPHIPLFCGTGVIKMYYLVAQVSLLSAIWSYKCRYYLPFGRTCPYNTLLGCTSVPTIRHLVARVVTTCRLIACVLTFRYFVAQE